MVQDYKSRQRERLHEKGKGFLTIFFHSTNKTKRRIFFRRDEGATFADK